MPLTYVQALQDLKRIMGDLDTPVERNRVTELAVGSLEFAYRSLGLPRTQVLHAYMDMRTRDYIFLPEAGMILQRYARGQIDPSQATQELHDTEEQYRKAFGELGIQPRKSKILAANGTRQPVGTTSEFEDRATEALIYGINAELPLLNTLPEPYKAAIPRLAIYAFYLGQLQGSRSLGRKG